MHAEHPRMDEPILLTEHHVRLETFVDELKVAARSDDRAHMRDAWATLENGLLAHLAAEEEYILPAFAEDHPEDAASLRAEHAEIRRLLADLGWSVELKRLSLQIADDLSERLRVHASHEYDLLYPWAIRNAASRWPYLVEARRRPR